MSEAGLRACWGQVPTKLRVDIKTHKRLIFAKAQSSNERLAWDDLAEPARDDYGNDIGGGLNR